MKKHHNTHSWIKFSAMLKHAITKVCQKGKRNTRDHKNLLSRNPKKERRNSKKEKINRDIRLHVLGTTK